MITAQQPDIFPGLLYPLFFLIGSGISSYLLAKDKGRNVVLWTILGCIPGVNIFALTFFMGASNFRIEKKLDDLIESQRNKQTSGS